MLQGCKGTLEILPKLEIFKIIKMIAECSILSISIEI